MRLELSGFTDAARRPIVAAQGLAQQRGATIAGADDLLAGLLAENSEACDVLSRYGLTETAAWPPEGEPHDERVRLSDDLVGTVRQARVEATIRRHPAITSCHVAAAVLRLADVPDGEVGRGLAGSGVDAPIVIEALLDHAGVRLAAMGVAQND